MCLEIATSTPESSNCILVEPLLTLAFFLPSNWHKPEIIRAATEKFKAFGKPANRQDGGMYSPGHNAYYNVPF